MANAARLALAALLCGALALGACRKESKPGPTPAPSVSTSAIPTARTWPKDAPLNDGACTKHDDCAMVVWDGPSPPDPCCDARMGYVPVRRSYLEWFSDYRKQHCGGVTCPPAPFPGAEPIECARVARCVRGKCAPACNDPTYNRAPE